MQWFKDFFSGLLDWIIDVFLWVPQILFDWIVTEILWIVDNLPIPFFMAENQITDYIPPELYYFLYQVQFGYCLTIISSAYLFYFIRRIATLGIW
jgi:hypothetical protein